MSPEDAAKLLAACERAAAGEQERKERERAAVAAKAATRAQKRQQADQMAAESLSFAVVPPDAGPLIVDGVDYTGPEPPDPWLDGERVQKDEPGWRVVGRQKVPR